ARAVPASHARRGGTAPVRVRAQAAAPHRARRRGRRRTYGGREPGRPRPCRTHLRLRRQRRVDACPELGRGPQAAGHARRQLRLRRDRGGRDAAQVAGCRRAGATRGARGAVPRHRRSPPCLSPRAHRRRGGRPRRAAGADPPRLAAAAPQPARAVREAPPARGAERDPRLRPLPAHQMKLPDVNVLHRRARRFASWTGSIAYRSIVVPLLDREESEHALDLACRLAADRGARVVLVAPLVVERELPLDAHMDGVLTALKERLECAAAVATSYGVAVRLEIVRTRPGSLGEDVARVAAERRAELVVVGAAVDSQRGFHHAFQREVLLLLRAAPCRVMIATGPVAGRGARATVAGTTVPPWHDGVARRTSSSASSGRTPSSPQRTATSARRSTTRS